MRISEAVGIVIGGVSGLGEATVRQLVTGGARATIFSIQVDKRKT